MNMSLARLRCLSCGSFSLIDALISAHSFLTTPRSSAAVLQALMDLIMSLKHINFRITQLSKFQNCPDPSLIHIWSKAETEMERRGSNYRKKKDSWLVCQMIPRWRRRLLLRVLLSPLGYRVRYTATVARLLNSHHGGGSTTREGEGGGFRVFQIWPFTFRLFTMLTQTYRITKNCPLKSTQIFQFYIPDLSKLHKRSLVTWWISYRPQTL